MDSYRYTIGSVGFIYSKKVLCTSKVWPMAKPFQIDRQRERERDIERSRSSARLGSI